MRRKQNNYLIGIDNLAEVKGRYFVEDRNLERETDKAAMAIMAKVQKITIAQMRESEKTFVRRFMKAMKSMLPILMWM